MVNTETFSQVYEHMKDKVKSFSASLLVLASILTNWDFLYFLATSTYSSRETISIAVDLYFSPWHLIWVYLFLSALTPIVFIISKTIFNRVNVPLERVFESYFRKITYPTREEYEKIVTKYEALEKSFKSGELYDDLKQNITKLKDENQNLKQDNSALNELINDLKSSSDKADPGKAAFVDSFFFGKNTEQVALILYDVIKNFIKSDTFSIPNFAEHFPNDVIYDEKKIREVLERWESDRLLTSTRTMANQGYDKFRLSDYGISKILG